MKSIEKSAFANTANIPVLMPIFCNATFQYPSSFQGGSDGLHYLAFPPFFQMCLLVCQGIYCGCTLIVLAYLSTPVFFYFFFADPICIAFVWPRTKEIAEMLLDGSAFTWETKEKPRLAEFKC